jgi:hypothetical protein
MSRRLRDIRRQRKRRDAEPLATRREAIKRKQHVPRRLAEQLAIKHPVSRSPCVVDAAGQSDEFLTRGRPPGLGPKLFSVKFRNLIKLQPQIDVEVKVLGIIHPSNQGFGRL